MNTYESKSYLNAVVQQITNNTTSWIGSRRGDSKNRIGGQTFTCPAAGSLDSIEIIPDYVNKNGALDLTIHEFDAVNKTWGPVLGASTVHLDRSDTGKWIAFPLKGLHLEKGMSYGFRLKSDECLVGVGEAAGSYDKLPFIGGQEWTASSDDLYGKYYSYLSLAFKVEMRA